MIHLRPRTDRYRQGVKPQCLLAPARKSPKDSTDLRQKVAQGSMYLIVRRALDALLGVFGVLSLTRLAGPHAYGLFTGAFGIVRFMTLLGEAGTKMYLLRCPRNTPIEVFHQAFWTLLFSGIGITALSVGGISLFGWFHGDSEGFMAVTITMCLSIPCVVLSGVPLALLERALCYRQVAAIEILSQIGYYGTGIALARMDYGVWAFVGAFWVGQIILFIGYYMMSGYRPRWYWNRLRLQELAKESFKLASASWVYELRLLGPSLILLPLAGATAVGYYALGQRLFNTLGFARDAIARLAVPIYAQVQDEPARLIQATYRSAQAQILVAGMSYLIFSLAAPFVLSIIFGTKWDTQTVMPIFAILSANNLFFIIFGAQTQALLVVKQSHVFMKSGMLYVGLSFLLSACLMLLSSEPYKVVSYTLGVVLAYIPYYFLMDRGMRRYVGSPRYGTNLLWAAGLGLALFASIINYWLLLGVAVLFASPSRREIMNIAHFVRKARAVRTKS